MRGSGGKWEMFESVLKESIEDGGSPCVDKECDECDFFFLFFGR